MNEAKNMLFEAIKEKGRVEGEIVKVDTFLNHLVDVGLLRVIGKEIAEQFKDCGATKIISSEASGIVIAHAVANEMNIPYVFAKKKKPITMTGFYSSESYSYTKQNDIKFYISVEVLLPGDKLLFIDDFYAEGSTLNAMEIIAKSASAEIVGKAVVINKSERTDVYSIATLSQIKEFMDS